MMLLGLEASVRMNEILDKNISAYCLSASDAKELEDNAFCFCECVVALIKTYHPGEAANEIALFGFTVKTHYLLHLALCGHYTNPNFGSCSAGEDMMGFSKRIVASSARASKAWTAANTALYKYRSGCCVQLQVEENGRMGSWADV